MVWSCAELVSSGCRSGRRMKAVGEEPYAGSRKYEETSQRDSLEDRRRIWVFHHGAGMNLVVELDLSLA